MMKNKEPQSKRIPIQFETDSRTSTTEAVKKTTGPIIGDDDTLDTLDKVDKVDKVDTPAQEIALEGSDEPQTVELEQIEAVDEEDEEEEKEKETAEEQVEPLEEEELEGPGLSATEVAQILIDLSESQERTAKLTEEKK